MYVSGQTYIFLYGCMCVYVYECNRQACMSMYVHSKLKFDYLNGIPLLPEFHSVWNSIILRIPCFQNLVCPVFKISWKYRFPEIQKKIWKFKKYINYGHTKF